MRAGVCTVASLLSLAACKERGTITITLVNPCSSRTLDYLTLIAIRGQDCNGVTLETVDATCNERSCQPLCSAGKCDESDLMAGIEFEPDDADTYAIVARYTYVGDTVVGGFSCAAIVVEPDGTQSSDLEVTGQCAGTPVTRP